MHKLHMSFGCGADLFGRLYYIFAGILAYVMGILDNMTDKDLPQISQQNLEMTTY